MEKKIKRKRGRKPCAKKDTVYVRLDQKMHYLGELAARKQRRNFSNFVEWAVAESIKRVCLGADPALSVADEAPELWDVDEAERLARLAKRHPYLLTYEEEVRLNQLRQAA